MQEPMDNRREENIERWAEEGGPPQLRESLSEIYGSGPAVSRAVDERILGAAREQMARRVRMRWMMRYAIGSVAAAAAVVLIVIRTTHHAQPAAKSGAAMVAAAEDVNRDGKIDILDAYLMARSLAAKEAIAREWDFNHDGIVDGRDVDVIALAAVKLRGEEIR
jgi:hypothetical protein